MTDKQTPTLPDLKWLRENLDDLHDGDKDRAIALLIEALEEAKRELNEIRDKQMQIRMMGLL